MSTEGIDSILTGIIGALDSTKEAIETIGANQLDDESVPSMVEQLMAKANVDKLEGVSLLSLKNESLVSYLNNLSIIVLNHLQRLKSSADEDEITSTKAKAVENTIVQRVTLEKGIKPLEKKLNYQLEKMIRSYNKMIEDETKLEAKLTNKSDSDAESGSGSDSESDSEESEDDALSYKPDVNALKKSQSKFKPPSSSSSGDVYKPPKISAVAPPTATITEKPDRTSGGKLQSMEEYLQESSELPQSEVSIGSSILNNGRGGVKTNRDRQKELEIQTYEENNFTRLPSTMTKKSFKQKQNEKINNFAGEDWSIFNNNRNIQESTSRKRKATTAWDKIKKRR